MTDITIGRLDCHYSLTCAPASAPAVRARLDRVAERHLGGALEALAQRLGEAGGEEVWLLRDLEVDVLLDLDTAATASAVADAWARRVLGALRQRLAQGTGVVRFASRAAWTACFVAELAAGRAWDRWYLEAFAPLRPLPVGRAIAEAIAREPAAAADVLARLAASGDLEAALLRMTPGDARRVVGVLAPPGPVTGWEGRHLAETLAALAPPCPADQPHLPGCALRLLAAAVRRIDLPPGAGEVAAAVAVLADLAGGGGPVPLARAVADGRWGEVLRLAGRPPQAITADELAAGDVLRGLAGGDRRWLETLAGSLTADRPAGAEEPTVATPFGGLLLLWPAFVEVWREGAASWDAAGTDAGARAGGTAAVRRVLTTASLYGQDRREALLRDPVLALLCGLERPPAPALIAEATADLPAGAIEAAAGDLAALVHDRFAARLPGFAGSTPAYLVRNFLDVPATVRARGGADRGAAGGAPPEWSARVSSPPLDVVLRMAGMGRLRYRLPWPPEATVTVELG